MTLPIIPQNAKSHTKLKQFQLSAIYLLDPTKNENLEEKKKEWELRVKEEMEPDLKHNKLWEINTFPVRH